MEKIFESEYRFLCIIWEHEPVSSPRLVELCSGLLGWKKSTTYTVLRKLAEKGLVQNENTIVTSLVSKEQVDRQASDELLERTAGGDVPRFLAAFLKDRRLTDKEIEKIRKLIDAAGEQDVREG